MNGSTQPWLPDLRVEKIKKERRMPQPRVERFRAIKKFEILHRPFDLRFRGRLNKWLTKLFESKTVNFDKILDAVELRVLKLYLFPRKKDGKWLTQKEVTKRIKDILPYKVRNVLVSSLTKIWENTKSG